MKDIIKNNIAEVSFWINHTESGQIHLIYDVLRRSGIPSSEIVEINNNTGCRISVYIFSKKMTKGYICFNKNLK
jgi:aspartate 1-decarboxylase